MLKEKKITQTLYVLSTIALLIATFRGETSLSDYYRLQESAQVLQGALDKMKTEIGQLELEIEKIKESSSYAQKVLRDKYHITDDNEFIIFFAD